EGSSGVVSGSSSVPGPDDADFSIASPISAGLSGSEPSGPTRSADRPPPGVDLSTGEPDIPPPPAHSSPQSPPGPRPHPPPGGGGGRGRGGRGGADPALVPPLAGSDQSAGDGRIRIGARRRLGLGVLARERRPAAGQGRCAPGQQSGRGRPEGPRHGVPAALG